MQRTRVGLLVAVASGTGLAGAALLRLLESRGVHVPGPAWIEVAATVLLAGLILWFGWSVRAYLRGDRPDLDPLRAARTFAMAKAGAYTGALLAGRAVAHVIVVVPQWGIEAQRADGLVAIAAAVAAVLLSVAGLVVEKFCEVPPPEHDNGEAAGAVTP